MVHVAMLPHAEARDPLWRSTPPSQRTSVTVPARPLTQRLGDASGAQPPGRSAFHTEPALNDTKRHDHLGQIGQLEYLAIGQFLEALSAQHDAVAKICSYHKTLRLGA